MIGRPCWEPLVMPFPCLINYITNLGQNDSRYNPQSAASGSMTDEVKAFSDRDFRESAYLINDPAASHGVSTGKN